MRIRSVDFLYADKWGKYDDGLLVFNIDLSSSTEIWRFKFLGDAGLLQPFLNYDVFEIRIESDFYTLPIVFLSFTGIVA